MKSLSTLELFAYGKWGDYSNALSTLPKQFIELNEAQSNKLKQLTIVALAEQNKVVLFSKYDTFYCYLQFGTLVNLSS